mgnify:CR=1 FL=1
MTTSEFEVEVDLLRNMVSARWLMAQDFPPLEYVVPGLIPEGLTLLAAAPKIGKSWLVLGLGIACASGGYAFGQLPVDRRPVLYLALEDGQRRLRRRRQFFQISHPRFGKRVRLRGPKGQCPRRKKDPAIVSKSEGDAAYKALQRFWSRRRFSCRGRAGRQPGDRP